MTLAALQPLIAAGESVTPELKKSTAEKDRACRSLCALANGQGGQVVFGVTPAGKVVGQKVTDHTLEELAQEFQGFEPPLLPHFQRIPLTQEGALGLEVLLVQVARAAQSPVSFRGAPYELEGCTLTSITPVVLCSGSDKHRLLGLWKKIYNPAFNSPEFDAIKKATDLNRFTMTAMTGSRIFASGARQSIDRRVVPPRDDGTQPKARL